MSDDFSASLKRLHLGIGEPSLRALAVRSDIPESTISDWLAGNRVPRSAKKLRQLLLAMEQYGRLHGHTLPAGAVSVDQWTPLLAAARARQRSSAARGAEPIPERPSSDIVPPTPMTAAQQAAPVRAGVRDWRRRSLLGLGLASLLAAGYVMWPVRTGDVQIQGTMLPNCPAYYTQQSPAAALADATRTSWSPWPGGTLVADPAAGGLNPIIEVTAQTSSEESVILTAIKITNVVRKPLPTHGTTLAMGGCGAGQDARPFSVDLDRTPASVTAQQGLSPLTQFPFRIETNDPEVFMLYLSDTRSECWFTVEVDWVNAGKPGRTTISDDGRPFHVIGDGHWPGYMPGGGPASKDGLLRMG